MTATAQELRDALQLLEVGGEKVWWCETHNSTMQSPIQKCIRYWGPSIPEEPCRSVERLLIPIPDLAEE